MEMTSLPPPERVPMIEAPPPMSEPSPTTTPAEMRPSTIEVPSVPGVEVDEALVHHGGADGQVRAEADPVGVGDPHAAGHHVVDHAGELVHAVDGRPGRGAQPQPGRLEALDRAGAVVRPHDVGQQAEDAVEVEAVRLDQAVPTAGAAAGRRRARRRGPRRAWRCRCGPRRPRRRGRRRGRARGEPGQSSASTAESRLVPGEAARPAREPGTRCPERCRRPRSSPGRRRGPQ